MPRVSDPESFTTLSGTTDRTYLLRTVDELRKDVQYLEEKRRKLHQFVEDRRDEARQCEQQTQQTVAQLRETEEHCRREIAALHSKCQEAEAELRRREGEVQAARDALARELEQKQLRLRTMDEEVMRKRCETDAAISNHIKSLTAEVEGKRSTLVALEAEFARKQAALVELEAQESLRRRELQLEDEALAKQMQEHQALCDTLRTQATEQLKEVEQQLATRRQELATETRNFEVERFTLEARIANLQRDVNRLETSQVSVQQREQSLTEQRRLAVSESQRLTTMVEDVSSQLEAARRATEAQALLAREWQALSEQVTATQKQEAALRNEATRTVEELRDLLAKQEATIEHLQRPPPGPDAVVAAEQMRIIEADFRAMKVTLDDSLALQSRLQSLLEDERLMRSAMEEQLRTARVRSSEGDASARTLHAQLLASEKARGVLQAELQEARTRFSGLELSVQEEEARRETRADALACQVADAEAALQQQAAETVGWRSKCVELQLQLLRAQEDVRSQMEQRALSSPQEEVWDELQQALARIQLVETQLQTSELERRTMQQKMEEEKQLHEGDQGALIHQLQAKVVDLQGQLRDAKAVAGDMECLLKREDEERQRLQAQLARSAAGNSGRQQESDEHPLQTICQGMQDELAEVHADRVALAADLAESRERAMLLELQLEQSEEVRRSLAQQLAQANTLRQRLEARSPST